MGGEGLNSPTKISETTKGMAMKSLPHGGIYKEAQNQDEKKHGNHFVKIKLTVKTMGGQGSFCI